MSEAKSLESKYWRKRNHVAGLNLEFVRVPGEKEYFSGTGNRRVWIELT